MPLVRRACPVDPTAALDGGLDRLCHADDRLGNDDECRQESFGSESVHADRYQPAHHRSQEAAAMARRESVA
jgi:hypothetical protein